MLKNNIEILSPAGDFESVVAAVQNGANAVYLGLKEFSARKNAKNFDKEELFNAVSYCHIRGVKVYLALNTVVSNKELDIVSNCIKIAVSCGVDAIIVQDFGVFSLIKKICPTMPLHASTQMTVHTVKGAVMLKELGFERVVLAREMSYEQMKEITDNVDIETEVFVHGALCMCVSGQCYLSHSLGGRSGNRGECAGSCRLPFNTSEREYALSLKDNCLVSYVDRLKAIGVTSIKIEGRMKRPEYVAGTTKEYYNSVNDLQYDIKRLSDIFSRDGFTDGYFVGNIDKNMFGYRQKENVVSATPKLLKELSNSYKGENPLVAVDIDFNMDINNATIKLTDLDGNISSVSTQEIQKAITKSISKEDITKSLEKLGGTPYYINNISVTVQDGIFIKASDLNELRRCACDKLTKLRGKINPLPSSEYTLEKLSSVKSDKKTIRARFSKVNHIINSEMFEYIVLPIDEISENICKNLIDNIIIEPYRVMFGCENEVIDKLTKLKAIGYNHLMCSNIAHIKIGKQLGFILHGDCYLNCTNSLAYDFYKSMGVVDIISSFEIGMADGIVAYGHLPLMIFINCPGKCGECTLTDRYSVKYKLRCNGKYSELFNPKVIKKSAKNIAFDYYYFTDESTEEIKKLLEV